MTFAVRCETPSLRGDLNVRRVAEKVRSEPGPVSGPGTEWEATENDSSNLFYTARLHPRRSLRPLRCLHGERAGVT